jgi:hypothetical protein
MLRVAPGTFVREYVEELSATLAIPPGAGRDGAVWSRYAQADPTDRAGKVHAMRALSIETLRRLGTDNNVDAGGWDLRPRLAALKIPTTILIAGEGSVVAPQDLAERSPAVTVEIIEDHDHTLHRSAFARFVAAVRAAS